MSLPSIPFLRFHILRMARSHPLAVGVLALCVALATAAAVALAGQANRAHAAQSLLTELRAKSALTQAAKAPAPAALSAAPDLPPFQSAQLVSILNETATDSGLVLDEVAYTLDNNANQPYMRYRITMSLNATYPLIRRLAEQLNANVPHLTLDAINCSRKDVVVAELNCDLVMSGFFRKDARG